MSWGLKGNSLLDRLELAWIEATPQCSWAWWEQWTLWKTHPGVKDRGLFLAVDSRCVEGDMGLHGGPVHEGPETGLWGLIESRGQRRRHLQQPSSQERRLQQWLGWEPVVDIHSQLVLLTQPFWLPLWYQTPQSRSRHISS